MRQLTAVIGLLTCIALLTACGNNPYPDTDSGLKVRYLSYSIVPRTIDPAVSFEYSASKMMSNSYARLLEYDYAERPYKLIPSLAAAMPTKQSNGDGWDNYHFSLLPDLLYEDNDCFSINGSGVNTRPVVSADIEFQLKRVADPKVNSPIFEVFTAIDGMASFRSRLTELREADPRFIEQPVSDQYAAAGSIRGIDSSNPQQLLVRSSSDYPQVIYWFASSFTVPMPWEAVEYYDGENGRPALAETMVGAGPYKMSEYRKQSRMVFERNPNWHGTRHPEWKAPGTVFPTPARADDPNYALFKPSAFGTQLPFIERIEYRREAESIPFFTKFLQGYYDAAGIIKESFDHVVTDSGGLSEEMAAAGIRLDKEVGQDAFFLSFNMNDPLIGRAGGEASRKLRQAMSLVVDSDEFNRLFSNGRNLVSQSIIPPGLSGYDKSYRNPFRQVNLERAKALVTEAGYPNGIDPATGKPLQLVFATYDTSSSGALTYGFYTRSWRQLGIDVVIEATDYNQYRKKTDEGSYQIVLGGWVADYPDPENFFAILTSENALSNGGYSASNFSNTTYDALYQQIKSTPDGQARDALLRDIQSVLENERPIIELWHRQVFALYHGWLDNLKPSTLGSSNLKYVDINTAQRNAARAEWNQPVLWPLFLFLVLFVVLLIPAILTYLRERQ